MSAPVANTVAASSVRVELVVGHPEECPVAAVSEECDATVSGVSRCCDCTGDAAVTEFTVTGDQPERPDLDPVFTTESGTRYRDQGAECRDCAVSVLGTLDCPVTEIRAEHGDLHLVFYARGMDQVRDIVAAARESYDDVRVKQLTTSGSLGKRDPVLFDADRLTDRQQEVLLTAYEMGYFAHPKEANATEVADALDIAPSTLAEHLAAAQRKLVGALVAAQSPEAP
jgi:predicted DNA binding protein